MRTSSSWRCTWMRAPSSFHSTDASPTSSSAAATSGALPASIGCTPRPTSSPTACSPASPLGERDDRDPAEVAGHHRGPADERGRHRRRLGHGVGHQPRERTLAELADEQAAQEVDLLRGGPVEHVAQDLVPTGRRPAAGRGLDPVEHPVDVGDRQAWARSRARPRRLNTRRPPDADAALTRLAGEEPHRRLDLVGREADRAARPAPRSWSTEPASTRPQRRWRRHRRTAPRQCARLRTIRRG